MPSAFPGMDPFIERPAIWSDFHDALVAQIRGALQPLLRPRYVALMQDRLYVVESERPIRPDVSVIRTNDSSSQKAGGSVALAIDEPVVFELQREEISEPVIHIIEPAAGNRLVTAIEVLSPSNKTPGEGRRDYLRKREELWTSGANLVEIDLLRDGDATLRVSPHRLAELRPWRYLVGVTRRSPGRQELYPIPLQSRLPRIRIPLAAADPDVSLDLQAAFSDCWNERPYPELLRYDLDPPGTLSSGELAWCKSRVADVQRGAR